MHRCGKPQPKHNKVSLTRGGLTETYTTKGEQTKEEMPLNVEAETTRSNMMLAYQRVAENKGAIKKVAAATFSLLPLCDLAQN